MMVWGSSFLWQHRCVTCRSYRHPDITFEMLHVYDVEADDGRVKPDVSLGDRRPKVIRPWARGEVSLDAVEGDEELLDVFLVRFLGAA